MDKKELAHFKDLLLKERSKVEGILNKMENNFSESMEEYTSELSAYDNHPADLGTEMFMKEHDMGLKNKNNDTIYEIEESLRNIDEGNYGICKVCGKEIDFNRLELLPYAKLCIDCSKKRIPLEKKMSFRPEEEDRPLPFSKSHIDELKSEGIEFDREDSYQAVARFNMVKDDPSDSTGDNQGIYDDLEDGIVEDVEKISEEYYKDTL